MQTLHPVSFTKDQSNLLQILSRNDLVANTHAAVTATSVPAKKRTQHALAQMDRHIARLETLKWRSTDSDRAYRTLTTPGVADLLRLVTEAVPELMDLETQHQFERLSTDLLDGFKKALRNPTQKANFLTQFKPALA